jgi:hypothetical protein
MSEYICPRDGETFSERPANGRCPTHKVLVAEVSSGRAPMGTDAANAKKAPPAASPQRATSQRPARR